MRHKNIQNRDLPPRMIRRTRKRKSGKTWEAYYYNGRDVEGNRKEIPLGRDLDAAKVEWARLERREPPKPNNLLGALFDKYEKKIIPTKSIRTQSDNRKELKQLRKAFEDAPLDSITPRWLRRIEMPEPPRSGQTERSHCCHTCSRSRASGD